MDKRIIAEHTLSYREIDQCELNQFQLRTHIRRNKKRRRDTFDYRKKLFSSNYRPFIMMANGLQTNVAKGSDEEWMYWHVKDSLYSPGNNYYFDSPEDAERVLKVHYSPHLKKQWHERVVQYRINEHDDDDESTVNDVTIIK